MTGAIRLRSIILLITIAIAFLLTYVSAEGVPEKGISAAKVAQMSIPEIEEAVLVCLSPIQL